MKRLYKLIIRTVSTCSYLLVFFHRYILLNDYLLKIFLDPVCSLQFRIINEFFKSSVMTILNKTLRDLDLSSLIISIDFSFSFSSPQVNVLTNVFSWQNCLYPMYFFTLIVWSALISLLLACKMSRGSFGQCW